MKKIIIITGISGTGKSTLAQKLYQKIENSTLLSMDTLAENIYDIAGFKNKKEKQQLKKLYTTMFKKLLETVLKREDEIVIVEYPFKKEWISFFERIIEKYHYEAYTIRLYAKDFETIWERLQKREPSKQRHPSHYLEAYELKNKNQYKPYFEYKYDTLKKEYEENISNCIQIGTVIKVKDIEDLKLEQLITTINGC